MIATTGTWDPTDRRVLFVATNPMTLHHADVPRSHRYCLTAVNDIRNDEDLNIIDRLLADGSQVLIDSGVFWLTNEHKRAHGITMDEALALAPDEIEGFDALWNRYLEVHDHFGDRVWGMMELDQGGESNKRKTRAKLNDLGIFPIPVWHPLNDGVDYFDELASTHDRICLGNIVQADRSTRVRLLHTMYEKHREYPDLWVHVLGMSPNEWFHSLTIDSADASTWLGPVRWGNIVYDSMLRPLPERLDYDMTYPIVRDNPDNVEAFGKLRPRALAMTALAMDHSQRGWRHWQQRLADELGAPAYEPLP